MQSLSKLTSAQAGYYMRLARDDYYVSGGEPPGQWCGRGAEALGLKGKVEKETFQRLLDGLSPSGEPLVQQKVYKDRSNVAAIDLTDSAPKAVSVIWALAPEPTRSLIEKLHRTASDRAFQYFESEGAFCRRGKGGHVLEPAKLVAAVFHHSTSRSLDMNLHLHRVIDNFGQRPDGTWGRLDTRQFYQFKRTLGALYRTELAYLLEKELGVKIHRKSFSFTVDGVPQNVLDQASKRRKDIEREMKRRGVSGAKAAEKVTLQTRETKRPTTRKELFDHWAREAAELNFTQKHVAELCHRQGPRTQEQLSRSAERLGQEVVAEMTATRSYFSKAELVRRIAERAPGTGLRADAILTLAHRLCQEHLVHLGQQRGQPLYTTRAVVAMEYKLLRSVRESRQDVQHVVSEHALQSGLRKAQKELRRHTGDRNARLSNEQERAVKHLTQSAGSVQCLEGEAGSGKDTTLRAARAVWKKAGLKVIGITPSAATARAFQQMTGIEAESLNKRLFQIAPTLGQTWKHHARQLFRAARNKRTYRPERLKLSEKHVVVLSGEVGTAALLALTNAVRHAGAKLVLSYDPAQLQPHAAGTPFHAIAKRVGVARLTDNHRQHRPWERHALKLVRAGDSHEALAEYAIRRRLHVAETAHGARRAMVRAWHRLGKRDLAGSLMIAGTQADADRLNREAQRYRQRLGEIGRVASAKFAQGRSYIGDRVVFVRRSSLLDVTAGERGTIERIGLGTVTVRLDRTRGILRRPVRVTVRRKQYPHLALGYAMTTRESRGAAIQQAFVLTGEWMQDREQTYTQLSRASGRTHIFTTELEAGEDLSELCQSVKRSRQKILAHDVRAEIRRTGGTRGRRHEELEVRL